MKEKTYSVYLDYTINNNDSYGSSVLPDDVSKLRKLVEIPSNHVDGFINIFNDLASQFNTQTGIINLKNNIELNIFRNDEEKYIIVYYKYTIDTVRRIPIQELNDYLAIVIDAVHDVLINKNGPVLNIDLQVPEQAYFLNLSWGSDLFNNEVVVSRSNCRYPSLKSAYRYKSDKREYDLENEWSITVVSSSEVSVDYN